MKQTIHHRLVGNKLPRKWPHWLSACGSFILTKRGWRVEGELINDKKVILAVAPHTSNWDFFIGILVVFALRIKVNFFGKHTIFTPPLGYIVRKLGGIPIERSKAHGVVNNIVRQIQDSEEVVLALAPEGTRKGVFPWKSGFMYIAKEANIPIQLLGLDYATKTVVLGPIIDQIDDIEEQMQTIYAFYANVCAHYPKNCITS